MHLTSQPANVYLHRQAGTPKSCFVCYKQTTHVLVSQSLPTQDFMYVCHAHLADRHFATKLSDPSGTSTTATTAATTTASSGDRLPDKVSQQEIDKIKQEYEAKLKQKKDKDDKDKDKDKSGESKPFSAMSVAGSVFSTVTSTVSGLASSAMASIPNEAAPSAASTPTVTATEQLSKQHPLHATYALHREFYAARVRNYNERMFKTKERQLNMPPAPKNALP